MCGSKDGRTSRSVVDNFVFRRVIEAPLFKEGAPLLWETHQTNTECHERCPGTLSGTTRENKGQVQQSFAAEDGSREGEAAVEAGAI